MTTTDADTATRRGRMMSTGEITLSVADFAALLQTTVWYPASPAEPVTPTEHLLARCWQDLAAVRPELAQTVWTVALSDGAHPTHVISLASLVAPPTKKGTPR
jgi:hypothetical protein